MQVPDKYLPKPSAHTRLCRIGILTDTNAVLLLLLLALLAGCAGSGTLRSDGRYPEVVESGVSAGFDTTPADLPPLEDVLAEAQALHNSGQLLPAELAATLVDVAVHERRWDIADPVVRGVKTDRMNVDEYARFSLAAVNYFNTRRQYRNADRWLHSPRMQQDMPMMSARDQVLLGLQRADTLYGMQQFAASAMERIFLHDLIERQSLRDNNADNIWRALQHLDKDTLQSEHRSAKSRSYRAWLELAMLERDALVAPENHDLRFQQWRSRWPQHPASLRMPGRVDPAFANTFGGASTVAVMLPTSGALAQAGKALRDGLSAAHFAASASGRDTPTLIFFDSSSEPIESLYLQAEQQGAEFILGPLQKEQVKSLFTMPSRLPILTLNFVDDELPPPDNVVQFGLAAEDEAEQLAEVAQQRGAKSVLVLHVSKSWAERAAWAFTERWLELGGAEPGVRALSSIENYSAEMATSFALHESKARHRRMQNLLGKKMEFKPRRRQDIDMVVIFANSSEAKAIKPLLAYHYAGDLPVMGSSQIYDNNSPANKNRDLNGIVFSEMPWILDPGRQYTGLPTVYQRSKSLARLFAMGVDAYQLQSRLDGLKYDPLQELVAHTGNLSVVQNRVIRKLPLATIESGSAVRWQLSSESETLELHR
ncbi:MAG: penicillin-binding protein activator [Gammaproteobacteria bacterium]|nr:penicillin-binding protein activator [Gammaproteobacteria bacterium]NNM12109.1 penicillin-binding protein activator [Pseudomonadales bacterium]